MNPAMKKARDELTHLIESSPTTKGLLLRVHGKTLTLSRPPSPLDDATNIDARVRLTHLGGDDFGLSVLRHTGKWEKTPFMGSLEELFEVIRGPMQHLIADW